MVLGATSIYRYQHPGERGRLPANNHPFTTVANELSIGVVMLAPIWSTSCGNMSGSIIAGLLLGRGGVCQFLQHDL